MIDVIYKSKILKNEFTWIFLTFKESLFLIWKKIKQKSTNHQFDSLTFEKVQL